MTRSSPNSMFFEAGFMSRLFFEGEVAVQQVIDNRIGGHGRELSPVGVDVEAFYQDMEQKELYAVAHGKDQQKGQAFAYHSVGTTTEYPQFVPEKTVYHADDVTYQIRYGIIDSKQVVEQIKCSQRDGCVENAYENEFAELSNRIFLR